MNADVVLRPGAATTAISCRFLFVAFLTALHLSAPHLAGAQTERVLHSFRGPKEGAHPDAGLVRDKNDDLYGTTYQEGSRDCNNLGCGTVFRLSSSGKLRVLYAFSGKADGATPQGRLILDKQGNLYGTTAYGGAFGDGTVFKVSLIGIETVLHSFSGTDGAVPSAGLVRDREGNLYGTTQNGGASYGTVFQITPAGTFTVLYTFTGGADGASPISRLVLWRNNLYGTTPGGGDFRLGTVFEVTKNGVEKVLHSFSGGEDGVSPFSGLVVDKQGNLFGTTLGGGGSGSGTVFKVTPTGEERVLYSFTGGADGGSPVAGLVRDEEGNFYGTTTMGGSSFEGTVFELSPTGTETVLHSFIRGSDGALPEGGLVRATNGTLYGTTFYGGPADGGTVFELIP
jgi:uncharacterized repeat protein (TIGR03803 family)